MIEFVFQALSIRNQKLKKGGADSITDQLNYRHTTAIFSVIVALIVFRYLIKEPIECYCPAQFTGSMVDFTNTVSYRMICIRHIVSSSCAHISFTIIHH